MQFEDKNILQIVGEKVGFLVSFFLFASVFYFILHLLDKIPSYLTYTHVVITVVVFYVAGRVIRFYFKNGYGKKY